MKKAKRTDKKGFTLVEILLVLGILGVIAVFTIGIAHSIRNMTKMNDTKSRMEQIAAKAKEYYRGHEELPAGTNVLVVAGRNVGVPVGVSEFNMEQKFRLDAWGRYMYYNRVENQNAFNFHNNNITINADTVTDIDGLIVDGRNVAGVIISYGPNQTIDTTINGDYAPVTYTTGGDDIVIPIDVSQQAVEIALEDLKVLQAKVKAFDAIYEGVDNNSSGGVDESGCVALDNGSGSFAGVCPPSTGGGNDPNCGTGTLDAIKLNLYSGCDAGCGWNWTFADNPPTDEPVNAFIYCLYGLADTLIYDPWLNVYEWGDATSLTTGTSDPRYHKFFSRGPNGLTDLTDPNAADSQDDIIP